MYIKCLTTYNIYISSRISLLLVPTASSSFPLTALGPGAGSRAPTAHRQPADAAVALRPVAAAQRRAGAAGDGDGCWLFVGYIYIYI